MASDLIPTGYNQINFRSLWKLPVQFSDDLCSHWFGVGKKYALSICRFRWSDFVETGKFVIAWAAKDYEAFAESIQAGTLSVVFENNIKVKFKLVGTQPKFSSFGNNDTQPRPAGIPRNHIGLPALPDRDYEGEQANAAEKELTQRQRGYPKRPSGGVLLGREIAFLAFRSIAGLWVGYQALRKARNTRMVRIGLLWMIPVFAGCLLADFCLLMLLLAAS